MDIFSDNMIRIGAIYFRITMYFVMGSSLYIIISTKTWNRGEVLQIKEILISYLFKNLIKLFEISPRIAWRA